jgi:hypothetical protein
MPKAMQSAEVVGQSRRLLDSGSPDPQFWFAAHSSRSCLAFLRKKTAMHRHGFK